MGLCVSLIAFFSSKIEHCEMPKPQRDIPLLGLPNVFLFIYFFPEAAALSYSVDYYHYSTTVQSVCPLADTATFVLCNATF